MRLWTLFRRINDAIATCGPAVIAFGLIVLIAAVIEPALPAVTGMACVALGATLATISRFRSSRVLCPVITAHMLAYASLYLLFIGAVFHPEDGPTRPNLTKALDIAMSTLPMFAAVGISIAAVAGADDAAAR
jgi:hypothetical protein